MNKRIILAMLVFVCLSARAISANAERFLNDGGISLKGDINGIRTGQKITLTVVKADQTWEDIRKNEDTSSIVYYGEYAAENEGQYELNFSLSKSGVYRAYVGTNALAKPEERVFEYVDKTKNALAIAAITAVDADIAAIMQNSRYDLGIFSDVYDAANLNDTANILRASLPQNETPDDAEFSSLAEKALLASALNACAVTDIDDFYDVFGEEEIASCYSSELSAALTRRLSGQAFENVSELDRGIKDGILLSMTEQQNGVGALKNALIEYAGYIGVNASRITTNLCTSIIFANGFDEIDDLKNYIVNYREPQPAAGGNGGTPSSSGNKNSFAGQAIAIPSSQTTETEGNPKTEDYSVFHDLADVQWAKTAITALYHKGIINGRSDTKFYPNDKVYREEFAKLITSALGINLVDDEFPFTDIGTEDWCYPYVKSAYLAGITKGVTTTDFGKGKAIKRQDLCVMVYNAVKVCGIELKTKREPAVFSDQIHIDDYALEAITALYCAGIISGDENGCFNPKSGATRAESAVIIYFLLNMK